MERQRSELVPIGDALSGMGGPVAAIRDATPQALHHFTQADQVNQLVAASEADPNRGFMARMMALCSLPRTNPGNRIRYTRQNGPYTLYMTAGGGNKLPFGNLPRLLMAYVSTEAVRTQSRVLILGDSLAKFMRTLGVYSSGGGNAHTKLRNQMRRLFGCTVQLTYKAENGEATVHAVIADRTEFWWNKPDERTLWASKIELSEKFFQEIIQHPVPIDMNTLTALKRCSLGLDLYLWLVYRTFALRAPQRLTWRQLYCQFEADPDKASDKQTIKFFRRKVLRVPSVFARVGFIVTNMSLPSRSVVRFYNKRGTAEQWIKEGKQATHWTRLSCHRFRANEVRLQLSVLAYNLGNLWRRLGLPHRIKTWSLTSLQQRLMKTGGRLVKHARYYWLLLAEGHLNRRLFGDMLRRIWALPVPGG